MRKEIYFMFKHYTIFTTLCYLLSASVQAIVLPGTDSRYNIEVTCHIDIYENLYKDWDIIYDNTYNEGYTPVFGYLAEGNGHAFGRQPATGAFSGQAEITGYQGQRLINSRRRNLGSFIGELRSAQFEIKGDVIDFLIGGGNFGRPTSLNLFLVENDTNTESVRQATSDNTNQLVRKSWDVAEFKGKKAYFQIIDYASIEPFGHSSTASFPEDRYGFILVDDIRQLDADGNRVDAQYDADRNFDFEKVIEPAYTVTEESLTSNDTSVEQVFAVKCFGELVGRFIYSARITNLTKNLIQMDHHWHYTGKTLSNVKFELQTKLPIEFGKEQYYLLPGLLYNGNPIGQATHYINEDFPEDTTTVPAGYSVEDDQRVFGGWVHPQSDIEDVKVSVRLQRNAESGNMEVIHSIPESAQFGRWFSLDKDNRLAIRDGFDLTKRFYYYAAPKQPFKHITVEKTGFRQVLNSAWKTLYPHSPENPPHSLQDDYRLKMDTLLDPYTLLHDVTVNNRNYYIWMVGRWVLPEDFNFVDDQVPMKYFHPYTGFSWSGMIGLTSYNAFKEYRRSKHNLALKAGMDTMDIFADNGISPSGILYPAWYLNGGFSSLAGPNAIDIGHLGEGLFWYIKCYRFLAEHNIAEKPRWLEVVKNSLDRIMEKFPDGDIPGRFNATDFTPANRHVNALYWVKTKHTDTWWRPGEGTYPQPSQGGPTNFSLLIWPYVSYYQLTGKQTYLDYAVEMGDRLISIINKYGVLSGMEVDYFNVDMRMSHAACKAFNHLYEATADEKWLEAAEVAGALLASWMNCYNVNFEGYEHTPLGYYDYRSVGGTFVDIKLSPPLCCFQQAATEFLQLWRWTGDTIWFERARANLLNGTQATLTENKRKWMNRFHQKLADSTISAFNPKTEFDPHVIGGGTENVLQAWPCKGKWTTQTTAIISLFMLAEGFDWDDIRNEFGSLTYDCQRKIGGALDSLNQVTFTPADKGVTITARNMLDTSKSYPLRLIGYDQNSVMINGDNFTKKQIKNGIQLDFAPQQARTILIQWEQKK